jgi:phage baseplate assembly protein W
MGRPIYQYKPINDRPDKAIGILLPFNKSADGRSTTQNYGSGSIDGGSVFAQSYSTEQQAISNLKNLLLTRKGERVMQPNFGTDIQSILFEQNTEDVASDLESSLRTDIEFWLPYINIVNLEVLRSVDQYTFLVRLTVNVTNIGANLVINVLASENQISVAELPTTTALVPVGFTSV